MKIYPFKKELENDVQSTLCIHVTPLDPLMSPSTPFDPQHDPLFLKQIIWNQNFVSMDHNQVSNRLPVKTNWSSFLFGFKHVVFELACLLQKFSVAFDPMVIHV